MSRRRRHQLDLELDVLTPLHNGAPKAKRSKISASRTLVTRSIPLSQGEQTLQTTRPTRAGKRRQKLDNQTEVLIINDENQFTDLEESIKRLRIRRPFVFSITSFIEQSVDSVSYNLTDHEPELVNND